MRKVVYFVTILIGVLFNPQCFSESIRTPIEPPPPELKLDAFYEKYLDCDGISVISSDRVDDRAFYRLQELLEKILANRPDLRQTLVDEGFRYIIIAHDEQVTDIPEYAHMRPKEFWNQRARGFGGRTTSCGEENLLNLPRDRYADESIFIHELAHSIHFPGLRTCDPAFQERLEILYKQAMDKGLYKNDYASTDPSEYWAESVQAFFDCDRENNWNHNNINKREELIEYDPNMVAFVGEIFKITDENDWRYKPLNKQPSVEKVTTTLRSSKKATKYVWCWDFSIYGTHNTSDETMLNAEIVVRNMFRYRYDILKAMIDQNVSVAVYTPEDMMDGDRTYLDIDLLVQEKDGKTITFLPEVLQLTPPDLQVLIHDLALTAYVYTGLRPVDPSFESRPQRLVQQYEKGLQRMDVQFDQKVKALYDSAHEKDLWKSTPAADNRFEYFAYGVMAFFDAGNLIVPENNTIHTREQLIRYDPDLASLIEDVFKHPLRTDWRYGMYK
jgi:hypothetical protein